MAVQLPKFIVYRLIPLSQGQEPIEVSATAVPRGDETKKETPASSGPSIPVTVRKSLRKAEKRSDKSGDERTNMKGGGEELKA